MKIKKIIATLLALLAWTTMPAQLSDGAWTFFPGSATMVSNVCPTPDGAYFLMGSNLYYYSPSEGESFAFSPVNRLSESADIAMIRYFDKGQFLFVGYVNGNIDLVYPSGKVINMADLKDAILTGSHQMTSAAYDDGRLFVGTDFGMVVFDTNRYEVIESGRYFNPVDALAVADGHVLMITNYGIYAAPVGGKHVALETFTPLWGTNSKELEAFGKTVAYVNNNTNTIILRQLDFSAADPTVGTLEITPDGDITQPLRATGEHLAVVCGTDVRLYAPDGSSVSGKLPADLRLPAAYPFKDLKDVWVSAFNKGVAQYDLAGTPTVKSDFFKPEGITVPKVNYMTWTPDGSGLYVGRYTTTFYNQAADPANGGFPEIQYTNLIEGDRVTDVSPLSINPALLEASMVADDGTPHYYTPEGVAGGPNIFVPDPNKEGRYMVASFMYGILAVEDNQVVHVFHRGNTPMPTDRWADQSVDVNFDSEGNMWAIIGQTEGPSKGAYIHGVAILPADKLKGDLSKIKRSDWIDARVPNDFTGTRDAKSIMCQNSDMAVFSSGGYSGGWLFINHNGTPTDTSDDVTFFHNAFYDQNGTSVTVTFPTAVAEDRNGRIWLGYDTGVMYTTAEDARQGTLQVRRPVVPRNDGTEFGDYLLDSEFIYSIAADHSDRKWFATANNGIYLVNADGTEILKHFTKDNSPLPSNLVYYVSVDPHSNKVYFGTEGGLVVYDSDSAPAAEDFSEVYAYPNPVRPEYTGNVTIAGLMDNSTVKIADAAGNVLFHARSEGGMVSWDACDSAGRRVRSGVYFVLAQSEASGSKESVVSKIMVIN